MFNVGGARWVKFSTGEKFHGFRNFWWEDGLCGAILLMNQLALKYNLRMVGGQIWHWLEMMILRFHETKSYVFFRVSVILLCTMNINKSRWTCKQLHLLNMLH